VHGNGCSWRTISPKSSALAANCVTEPMESADDTGRNALFKVTWGDMYGTTEGDSRKLGPAR
jgi:hypothetical protein